MSKRDHETEEASTISTPPNKRVKKHHKKGKEHQNAHIDPTWGQKYVFSKHQDATTIPAGEESDFEDDTDAMAYLMSVRTQAGSIPHLLGGPQQYGPQLPPELEDARADAPPCDNDDAVANDVEDYHEDEDYTYVDADERGWYEDGAYISYDLEPSDGGSGQGVADEDHRSKALEEAYYTSILRKYDQTRSVLNRKPPPRAEDSLPPRTPIHAEPFSRGSGTTSLWTSTILDRDPIPLQVALIPKDSICLILRVLLGGKLLRRSQPLPERTSRWLWALLARMPERNELTHYELGLIRDLGKRAVLLGRSLAEVAALEEAGVDGDTGDLEDVAATPPVEDQTAEYPEEKSVSTAILGAAELPKPSDADCADSAPATESVAVDVDDGEVENLQEDEDVPMDTESGSEEGEIDEEGTDAQQDLEDARKRLLEQLDDVEDAVAVTDRAAKEAKVRADLNQRATINMVLTITGEIYGQRDLLDFREPFPRS